MLADIGGPYVIAPVHGVLRLGGRVIGSFVMSVQDDVGFTKLESHAVGDPIGIYYERQARRRQLGAALPDRCRRARRRCASAAVTYSGRRAQTYNAFPTGTLTAVILVPPPAATLASAAVHRRCGSPRSGASRELLAARFHPLDASYANFVEVVHDDTGAIGRSCASGLRPIAGSQGIGPPVIPPSAARSPTSGKQLLGVLVRADAAGADLPARRGPADYDHDLPRRRSTG